MVSALCPPGGASSEDPRTPLGPPKVARPILGPGSACAPSGLGRGGTRAPGPRVGPARGDACA
eukprot:1142200-Pyramimonas_sp.AAC.1